MCREGIKKEDNLKKQFVNSQLQKQENVLFPKIVGSTTLPTSVVWINVSIKRKGTVLCKNIQINQLMKSTT